jgi:hypothetical protein
MQEVKDPNEKPLTSIFRAPNYPSINSYLDHYFSQEFSYLRPLYSPPWSVIKSVQDHEYFERMWLENELDKFLSEVDRGIFILEGEGGTGKTTFLAEWVSQQGAIHHFFEYAPGSNCIQTAKGSLGAQIIRFFQMTDKIHSNQSQEAIRQPNFLHDILAEAAQRRTRSDQSPKIMVVIDGFDEVGWTDGIEEFGVADHLPENVYLIISQPPQSKKLKTNIPVKTVHLGAASPFHLAELKLFCLHELSEPPYRQSKIRLNPDQLSDILVEKSNGNWITLLALLNLSKGPEFEEKSVYQLHANLPDSLCRCYLQDFFIIKEIDHAEWYRFMLPVLGVLSTYQGNVSVSQIAAYANLKIDNGSISKFLDHDLRKFISTGYHNQYRFKHPSLRDFFSGYLEKGNLTLQEESFLQELIENTRHFHAKFSQEILSTWGNLNEGLEGLRNKTNLTPFDFYGMDHLASHLIGGQSAEKLKALLNLEWVIEKKPANQSPHFSLPLAKKWVKKKDIETSAYYVNGWHHIKFSQDRLFSYEVDVKKAWQTCETVGEQLRYALILSSVSSMSPKTNESITIGDQEEKDQATASIAACMAKAGDSSGALTALEKIKNKRWKSQAYIEIANYAPSTSIPSILRFCYVLDDTWAQTLIINNCAIRLADLRKTTQAFEAARQIPVETHRNQTLSQLATKFFEENQVELALEAVHSIKNELIQADLLAQYTKSLEKESQQTVLMMVQGLRNNIIKAQLITRIAPFIVNPLQKEVLRMCEQIEDEKSRGNALAGVIPYLNETLLKDTIAAIRDIKDESFRAPSLVALTIRTAEAENPEKAYKLIPAIFGENPIASAIVGIAPYLNQDLRLEALAMVGKFKDPGSLVRALESLIPFLDEPDLEEVLSKPLTLKNEVLQNIIIGAIARRYLEIGEPAKAIALNQYCKSDEQRVKLLTDLIPFSPESLRSEILNIAHAIEKSTHRASVLLGIAPFLSEETFEDTLSTVITILDQSKLDIGFRLDNLIKIMILFTQRGEFHQALNILQEIHDDSGISQAIVKILPLLPLDYQKLALDALEKIQEPGNKISTLVELAPHLSASQMNNTIAKLQGFGDEKITTKAIVGLAPYAAQENFQDFLDVIPFIKNKDLRAQAISAVTPLWLQIPKPFGLFLWNEMIRNLAENPRSDLLSDLQALAPIISHLGGNKALKESLKAIHDVTRWWN